MRHNLSEKFKVINIPQANMNPKIRLTAIRAWRALTPTQQEAGRLRQIRGRVVRSMAFKGEPIPKGWSEAQRQRLDMPPRFVEAR